MEDIERQVALLEESFLARFMTLYHQTVRDTPLYVGFLWDRCDGEEAVNAFEAACEELTKDFEGKGLDRAIPITDFVSIDFRDRMFPAGIRAYKGSLYPAGVPIS